MRVSGKIVKLFRQLSLATDKYLPRRLEAPCKVVVVAAFARNLVAADKALAENSDFASNLDSLELVRDTSAVDTLVVDLVGTVQLDTFAVRRVDTLMAVLADTSAAAGPDTFEENLLVDIADIQAEVEADRASSVLLHKALPGKG